MTTDQFTELKSLILENSVAINRNYELIGRAYQKISLNYEMIGRVYEEHSARFDRVEDRLTGVERSLDSMERESADFRAEWRTTDGQFESRLKALES